MASYNRVVIMGNLTRDIELRYTPGKLAVSELSVAVNERRKGNDGNWFDEVSYFDVTLFGRTAEVASEYLSKGSPVLIEGRLKQDRWEKDGVKRSKVFIIGERMQMLGGRDGGGSGGASSGGSASSSSVREPDSSRGHYVNANAESSAPLPRRTNHDASPTGDGPGYDEPEIPF